MNSCLDMPTLRHSRADDWDDVRQLLAAAELPVDDLGPELLDGFLIAELDGLIVGLVGLQVFDTTGLLRSLVVAKNARSSGLGGRLVGALDAAAQTAGIDELWLLTIDAEEFFARHGFEIVAREQAPQSIRQSEEFRELCPEDAYLMCKSLI
jgi:amino-acid N-acetyltransferase